MIIGTRRNFMFGAAGTAGALIAGLGATQSFGAESTPTKDPIQGGAKISGRIKYDGPEIDFEKIDAVRGLDIAFTTSAKNDDEARQLLSAFGFPFRTK